MWPYTLKEKGILLPNEVNFEMEHLMNQLSENEEPEEIRMRTGSFLMIKAGGSHRIFSKRLKINQLHIDDTIAMACRHSVYAYEEELKKGYFTIEGGHRIGVCGETITDGKKICGMKHISSLNIRISHQMIGCADEVMPYIVKNNSVCNTLVISPPGCGKTTLLRDIIRQLSDGYKDLKEVNISVVDERNELAGVYCGKRENNLGKCTDVLTGCPKPAGMMLLIRSMSPELLAIDELGSEEDYQAFRTVLYCGTKVIATVHGESYEEVCHKKELKKLITDKIFNRYLVLSKEHENSRYLHILDEAGKEIAYVKNSGSNTAACRYNRPGTNPEARS